MGLVTSCIRLVRFVLLWKPRAAFVMLCSGPHNCSKHSRCIITIQHSISIPGNELTTKKSYLVHGWHVDVTQCLCERRGSNPFVRRFFMKVIYHRYTANYIAYTQHLCTCLNPLNDKLNPICHLLAGIIRSSPYSPR